MKGQKHRVKVELIIYWILGQSLAIHLLLQVSIFRTKQNNRKICVRDVINKIIILSFTVHYVHLLMH